MLSICCVVKYAVFSNYVGSTLKCGWFMLSVHDLWMQVGSLESTKEVLEVTAENNSSLDNSIYAQLHVKA